MNKPEGKICITGSYPAFEFTAQVRITGKKS